MSTFREFLSILRSSPERYIVVNEDGDPEFVILPYGEYRKKNVVKKTTTRFIAPEAPEQEPAHEESPRTGHAGWDAMMEELGQYGAELDEAETQQKERSEEPEFRFESVDE